MNTRALTSKERAHRWEGCAIPKQIVFQFLNVLCIGSSQLQLRGVSFWMSGISQSWLYQGPCLWGGSGGVCGQAGLPLELTEGFTNILPWIWKKFFNLTVCKIFRYWHIVFIENLQHCGFVGKLEVSVKAKIYEEPQSCHQCLGEAWMETVGRVKAWKTKHLNI